MLKTVAMGGHTGHQFAGASNIQNPHSRRCDRDAVVPQMTSSALPFLYKFADVEQRHSDAYELEIKQGPKMARVAVGKEKGRVYHTWQIYGKLVVPQLTILQIGSRLTLPQLSSSKSKKTKTRIKATYKVQACPSL